MSIFASVVITVIIFFLAVMIANMVSGKYTVEKDSLPLSKYDIVASLCIIFVTVYLLFHTGPFLGEIARHRVYREEADWFTYITGISSLTVFIFYLLGIYTIMRLLTRTLHLTGRRLYYWTIGIFIFAFWVFAIHGITIWGR